MYNSSTEEIRVPTSFIFTRYSNIKTKKLPWFIFITWMKTYYRILYIESHCSHFGFSANKIWVYLSIVLCFLGDTCFTKFFYAQLLRNKMIFSYAAYKWNPFQLNEKLFLVKFAMFVMFYFQHTLLSQYLVHSINRI